MSAVARPTLEEKESVLHIEKAAPGAGETLIIDGVDTGLDKNRGAREKEVYSVSHSCLVRATEAEAD
jgi:hypothetical protein